MPAAVQAASNTLPFATILTRIVNRIALGMTIDASVIRIVAAPDQNVGEYLSEQGLVLRVRPPVPSPLSGGDRHAYFVDRAVDVFVLTENLQDPGGRSDKAVALHLAREEAVVNSLHMQPPNDPNPIPGVTVKWVPGGTEIFRAVKTDVGLLTSVLPFNVTYRARMDVYRE